MKLDNMNKEEVSELLEQLATLIRLNIPEGTGWITILFDKDKGYRGCQSNLSRLAVPTLLRDLANRLDHDIAVRN